MIVYGPVASWRLGKSLGIDLISVDKFCSFDCIYCQLGRTEHKTIERKIFVENSQVKKELDNIHEIEADVITFSGLGEPTLARNLGFSADYARKFGLPIAILTNSSLFSREDVMEDLLKIDWIVAKLDAPDKKIFEKINSPHEKIKFDEMIEGIKEVRKKAKKFSLQMMFVKENKKYAEEMADLAREIKPDDVQINTPLRKSPVRPLSKGEIFDVEEYFQGLNAVNVYSSYPPKVKPIDYEEMKRRRPE